MTWGTGPWGSGSPWGTGTILPPPTISTVRSEPGPTAPVVSPAVIDEEGGSILVVHGTNFDADMVVELVLGGPGTYAAVASCYIFDARYDVQRTRCYVGTPAVERGLYHVRVTTSGGDSNVLEDVVAARAFAYRRKVLEVRSKWAPKWNTGPRILRGG